MPRYVIRHVAAGKSTGIPYPRSLQLALDERVITFSGISRWQQLVIVWNLLRGGMTIVEAP